MSSTAESPQAPHAHRPHGHGSHGGHSEAADAGEVRWANEAERCVALMEQGRTVASGERAMGERELAARQRRAATPSIIRRESLSFEPSSIKGIDIAYILAPHLGMEVRNVQLEVHRLAPDARTEAHQNEETVIHVLNGHGSSVIGDQQVDWGPHDSMLIHRGHWFQHRNGSDTAPAHFLVGKPSPIIEQSVPYAREYLGDDFTDLPDDYMPEHPFTGERVKVEYVEGQKWMSEIHSGEHRRVRERDTAQKLARVHLRADEARIQRSEHKGDWIVGLVDPQNGFDTRLMTMNVLQMPPESHTETHRHGEAAVYVLRGRGYSLIDGRREEWREGDCIIVQPGQWHQHFNSDPEQVSQFIALVINPLRELMTRGIESVATRVEGDYDPKRAERGESGSWWRSDLG